MTLYAEVADPAKETETNLESKERARVSAAADKSAKLTIKGPVLVLDASTAQGRAVIDGIVAYNQDDGNDAHYSAIYGATHDVTSPGAIDASNRGAILMDMDLLDPESIERVLFETKAEFIFLVTTTDLPASNSGCNTCKEAEDKEYDAIITFFDILVAVHFKDKIDRQIVFSTLDNVIGIINDTTIDGVVTPKIGQQDDDSKCRNKFGDNIQPLEDGSIVAHFSGKGRAGEYALKKLQNVPGVSLTLVTLPLLHSNFLGWAIPLPNEAQTQWTISAAFGDHAVDMLSVDDLSYIVPAIFEDINLYEGHNLRISAERISMSKVASIFSDIFGKDVVYNPLTPSEMAAIDLPHAELYAQMCQFLADDRSNHDVDLTDAVMFPRRPQLFRDWILTHSDEEEFERVGLTADAAPITTITVFGCTSLEGTAVVKGLLKDTRKEYKIIATSRDIAQSRAQNLKSLDPDRVTLVQCDFDDVHSCAAALDGAEGAFLVTDFYEGMPDGDPEIEEQRAKNVIDACADAKEVKHLVFSTHESVDEMNKRMKLGMNHPIAALEKGKGRGDDDARALKRSILPHLDAKARAAAYARTKNISCTFVLMPYYVEKMMELLAPKVELDEETGEESLVLEVPDTELRMMTISAEEMGPAVANIFDSYQVFAGREIGLVTDYVSVEEAVDVIVETMYTETDTDGNKTTKKIKKKETKVDKWIESRGTITKDLGQMFDYYSKSDAVKKRRSVAQTLQLVPDARRMKQWLLENRDNASFRQKMGIR